MDKETNLFDNASADVNEFIQDEQIDDNGDAILQTLVGEGKKYKTEADLARAAIYKDNHIKRIEEENRKLREATMEAKTTNEILQALKAQQNKEDTSNGNDNSRSRSESENGNNQAPSLTVDEVAERVVAALEAKTTKKTQEENLAYVKNELVKNFGPEYPSVIRQKANELGLDDTMATEMARKSPKAFFNLLGVNPAPRQNVAPNPSVRTQATSTGPERDFAYYEKIRKTDERKYMSREVQNALLADAFRLGERFYKK